MDFDSLAGLKTIFAICGEQRPICERTQQLDFTVDEGDGRLNPYHNGNSGKHHRRKCGASKQQKQMSSCVTSSVTPADTPNTHILRKVLRQA